MELRRREIEDRNKRKRNKIFGRTPQGAKNLKELSPHIQVLSEPAGMGEEDPAVRAAMVEKDGVLVGGNHRREKPLCLAPFAVHTSDKVSDQVHCNLSSSISPSSESRDLYSKVLAQLP